VTDPERSARLALAVSCLGHTVSHLFQPIFYVVALTLPAEFGLSHGQAISLIVAGNVLFGAAAPLAGWLSDRWNAGSMMVLFFLGTGTGMVLTGLASGPLGIGAGLALTGLFASIYHPVGITWLVRNARAWGKAPGINGIFGGLGPAGATLIAGALIELWGWRAAFIIPGSVVVLGGVVLIGLKHRGLIVERSDDRAPPPPSAPGEVVRAFVVLSLTMLATGLICQATQAVLPKLFAERVAGPDGDGVFGIALLVALVYGIGGLSQLGFGHLADRHPMPRVYLGCFLTQVPALLLAAILGHEALVLVSILMVTLNVGSLPAETGLVARYAPGNRRGLFFGLKFIIALGLSAFGVRLAAVLHDRTGDFILLFQVLAVLAAAAAAISLFLLRNERTAVRRRPA
jgi:MFS family permease